MKAIRFVASIASLAALASGYLASQYASFSGDAPGWAARIDSPAVVWIALALFAGSILLWVIPDSKENA